MKFVDTILSIRPNGFNQNNINQCRGLTGIYLPILLTSIFLGVIAKTTRNSALTTKEINPPRLSFSYS